MALDLTLTFGTPPSDSEFPGTPKALGDFLAEYFQITGGESFIPVNFGATEPDSGARGNPWFKTDLDGNPLGWYSWNGSTWKQMPHNTPNGPTANRPGDAVEGDLYYDTDIDVLLIYHSAAWITASGSPGDVKFVQAATIEAALLKNPGWSRLPEATYSGRVLGVAGSGSGLTPRNYADSVGEETHTLNIDEIPEHQHTAYGINNSRWKADGNATDPAGQLSGYGSNLVSSNPPTGEGGLAHNNVQPSIFLWGLVKD